MSGTPAICPGGVATAGWKCWFSLGPCESFPDTPEWDSLSATGCATPFGSAYWHRCWWASLARKSDRLLVYHWTDGQQTRAVVPLLTRGRLVRVLSAPFNPHTPVWDIACADLDPKVLESLIRHLGAAADRFIFPAVAAGEPLHDALIQAAEHCGGHVDERLDSLEAYIDMTLGWENYLAGRDKKTIQNYARKERQLARMGQLEYREIRSDPALKDLLGECYAVEHASWKGRRGSAIASRPETESFYTRLALAASRAGALSLKTLRLDGRLLAFDLSLRHRTEMFALKIGFDPEFAKHSPGQVLVYSMIRQLQNTGLTRFRLGPPSAWKSIWTDSVRPLSVVEITPAHARARALHLIGPGLRHALRRAPLIPRLPGR